MLTYITAFIFYTLAMVGVLLVGFVVYKKTFLITRNDNKGSIKIVDSLNIAPKKMLFVVKVKNEKFLIASGAEHTTFLAKLEDSEEIVQQEIVDEKKAKLDKIEQQFRDLYLSPEPDMLKSKIQSMDKKEIVKKLLKDLNQTSTIESAF